MNNRKVAAAFARGTGTGKGHNLFIDGTTVYSYGHHFPIATWTQDAKTGAPVVLFTTRGYSVTTSKHKSFVRGALASAGVRVVESDARTRDGCAVVWPSADFLRAQAEAARRAEKLRARREAREAARTAARAKAEAREAYEWAAHDWTRETVGAPEGR